MNKRGQFYLIAAVLLIAVMGSLITISNSALTEDNPQIYSLKEEIIIESTRVMDHVSYNGLSYEDFKSMMTDFSETYIDYYPNNNWYFIFGDSAEMRAVFYQKYESEVSLTDSSIDAQIGTTVSDDFTPSESNLTLEIDEVEYPLDINLGKNFYFVITSKNENQTYVATN